jgi:hypothetical protein
MGRLAMAQMLTANRLIDGTVMYWRAGEWVESFSAAERLDEEAQAKAALAAAQSFVTGNVVVSPYLFELRDGRPAKEREIIRALGPSVRTDLGKQAEEFTSPLRGGRRIGRSDNASGGGEASTSPPTRFASAHRPPREGEVTDGNDDVSI